MPIRIESMSFDALDPKAQAVWWAAALQWPDAKTVKNRLHLDLRPDDQAAEVARFEALGARRVNIGQTDDVTWVVLADPEGNEFCILRSKPTDGAAGS